MKVKYLGILILAATSISGCSRVPSTFGISDVDSAPGASAPNQGFVESLDLDRLNQIEAQIDASLARLDAAFDPNAPEANLDKLVTGAALDPALANSPFLTQDQLIDQKIDEKNKALINDEFSGHLDNVEDNTGLDPQNFSDINLRRAAQVEQNLDQKAIEAVKPASTPAKETVPSLKAEPVESEKPAPDDAQEGTRESLE